MSYYPLLKNIHIFIALLSGLGFAVRGYLRLVANRPLSHPVIRIAPHILDTLLLATGIALWVMVGWTFLSWLGLKIGLIVAYILIGMAAFRKGHGGSGIILYWLALGIYLAIAFIAVHKPI
ncbi:SirB2 family protein [Wenzhouxiangella sp. AB-CW3]|uniref:SirB2 family protein n=1 Tax=Wenzhouxiangella sp. AB-CW3 TaxID=2771012 RepID=UPI00168ABBDF|nr:SirB2 family protein [Wenzhouxiangella sp. AB-CW3]QOC21905.1 SirB2 family protein [Wenzhouxiangella sp. AB-CW3]